MDNAHNGKAGWIGKILGTEDHLPRNVAALIMIVIVTASIVFFSYMDDKQVVLELIQTQVAPIVTLGFGYLFGKGHSGK